MCAVFSLYSIRLFCRFSIWLVGFWPLSLVLESFMVPIIPNSSELKRKSLKSKMSCMLDFQGFLGVLLVHGLSLLAPGDMEVMNFVTFILIRNYLCWISGIINSILSWKSFIPLAKMTYVGYLIHGGIITTYMSLYRFNTEYSFFFLVSITNFINLSLKIMYLHCTVYWFQI